MCVVERRFLTANIIAVVFVRDDSRHDRAQGALIYTGGRKNEPENDSTRTCEVLTQSHALHAMRDLRTPVHVLTM